MRISVLWSLLFLLSFINPTQSQSWRATPYELFAGTGSTHYFGDIGGSASENNLYGLKDLDIFSSRPAIVAGIRYYHNEHIAINGSVALGWLRGNDAGSRNDQRGFIFNTIIFEPSVKVEYFPVRDFMLLSGVNRRGLVRNYGTISVNIFGGAGLLLYDVMPNEYLKTWQKTNNIEHGLVTIVAPAGVGMKLGVSKDMDVGFEIGGRYAFNDYLDGFTSDVSKANDIYYLTTIKLVYRLVRLREE